MCIWNDIHRYFNDVPSHQKPIRDQTLPLLQHARGMFFIWYFLLLGLYLYFIIHQYKRPYINVDDDSFQVGDRLFSAFGQDTIDALFWTATEPKDRKRHHIGVLPHFLLTITYVISHTLLVLLQATTLNVAVNASNKALLTIMMSNNVSFYVFLDLRAFSIYTY